MLILDFVSSEVGGGGITTQDIEPRSMCFGRPGDEIGTLQGSGLHKSIKHD